ncbi:MAG TPA: hypothetical protein VMR21_14585, partial [Vicinamibacteria bacterium]|nr:hypothetical protein [Vicinamibacteria bacterium]
MRRGWIVSRGAAVLVAVLAAGWLLVHAAELRLVALLQERGAAHGFSARAMNLAWPTALHVEAATLSLSGGGRLTADHVRLSLGLAGGGDPRSHVRRLALEGVRFARGPLAVSLPSADLEVVSWRGGGGEERVRLRPRPSGGEIDLVWRTAGADRVLEVTASGLDLSTARVSWASEPVLAPGSWSGRIALSFRAGRLESEGALQAERLRLALPRGPGLGTGEYGAPATATLGWTVAVQDEGTDVERLVARIGGVELSAHGRIEGPPGDRHVDLEVSTRTDLGPAL